uniref:HdeD family acid-resistance protein n=1 Tax=uncultured Draconibacterium sp. TaxID=1573823 RepID=UPI003216A143
MHNTDNNTTKKFAEGMWKLIMARGIVLLIIGFILLLFPTATLTTLIFIMGVYWLIEGIATVYNTIQRRDLYNYWWWGFVTGGLGIIAGIIVLAKPFSTTVLTTSFLIILLGIIALLNGISGIITSVRLAKLQPAGRSGMWRGVFSLILGILLISSPFSSAILFIKIIGSFSLFAGIITIALASRLNTKTKELEN